MVLEVPTARRNRLQVRLLVLAAPVAVSVLGFSSACEPLPADDGLCLPCEDDCPADLTCDDAIGKCVENVGDLCDVVSTATSNGAANGGSAGAGEEDTASGGSSTTTAPTNGSSGGASGSSGGGAGGTALASDGGSGGTTTGGAGTSSTSAGGSSTDRCESGGCDARVLTTSFGPFCAGASIDVELKAVCTCDSEAAQANRTFDWEVEAPSGLTPTPEGALSGTLPTGTYRFNASASTNENELEIEEEIVIEVVERCLMVFETDASTPGKPYLVASRLDSQQAAEVPRIGGATTSVSSFELAPDGRYLAQVETTGAESTLELFDLLGNDVHHVDGIHLEQYLAHAFSPDSHWLATVDGTAGDPATQTLSVIDLSAEPPRVHDGASVAYEAGLTWSTADRILYLGPVPDQLGASGAMERAVDSDGLYPETQHLSTQFMTMFSPFNRFFINEAGFVVVYYDRLCFLARDGTPCFDLQPYETWSPGLIWGANRAGESMQMYLLTAHVDDPVATIDDCETIRAWSADNSTLLCVHDFKPAVYPIDESGPLAGTPLPLTGDVSWGERVAFSRSGAWLALTPQEDGLVVLPREQFGTWSLNDVMLEQLANENWDFVFTSGEDRVIVQRGSELFVADLDAATLPPEFVPVADDLTGPPDCSPEGWYLDPPAWCGAPKFRGNLVLSPDERYLGFVRADQVVSVDLAQGDYPLLEHGTLAPGCGSDCIRFR